MNFVIYLYTVQWSFKCQYKRVFLFLLIYRIAKIRNISYFITHAMHIYFVLTRRVETLHRLTQLFISFLDTHSINTLYFWLTNE